MAKRARDWGIPFDGTHGDHSTIMDVAGVRVGHAGLSDNVNINTDVTAILPLGNVLNPDDQANPTSGAGYGIDTFVMTAWLALNGNGEMTGAHLIEESLRMPVRALRGGDDLTSRFSTSSRAGIYFMSCLLSAAP